jgi:hypothetical protein
MTDRIDKIFYGAPRNDPPPPPNLASILHVSFRQIMTIPVVDVVILQNFSLTSIFRLSTINNHDMNNTSQIFLSEKKTLKYS